MGELREQIVSCIPEQILRCRRIAGGEEFQGCHVPRWWLGPILCRQRHRSHSGQQHEEKRNPASFAPGRPNCGSAGTPGGGHQDGRGRGWSPT